MYRVITGNHVSVTYLVSSSKCNAIGRSSGGMSVGVFPLFPYWEHGNVGGSAFRREKAAGRVPKHKNNEPQVKEQLCGLCYDQTIFPSSHELVHGWSFRSNRVTSHTTATKLMRYSKYFQRPNDHVPWSKATKQ